MCHTDLYYNVICQIYVKPLQNPLINKIVKDIHRFHQHHHQRSECKVPPGCPGAAKPPPFAAPPGEPLYIIYDISSLYIVIFLYIMNYTYICGTTARALGALSDIIAMMVGKNHFWCHLILLVYFEKKLSDKIGRRTFQKR